MKIRHHKAGWNQVVKEVVQNDLVPRAQRIADACNAADGTDDGYRVSVEGDGEKLSKHDYHATVITATAEAIRKNAANNTLVNHFHTGAG